MNVHAHDVARGFVRRLARPMVALPLVFALGACSGGPGSGGGAPQPPELTDAFVKVARPLGLQAASLRTQLRASVRAQALPAPSGDESFYLAIHQRELNQRYFLSAFMKQFYPGAAAGGAGLPLGTLVVSFRVQNGKLFVFDATDNHQVSDHFDPALILEAYPIINAPGPFAALPGAANYIVFDPAAGLNKFGLVENLFDSDNYQGNDVDFQVDLAYLDNYRGLSDGVVFDEVFTGSTSAAHINDGKQTNVYRASGTLGVALRKYSESARYQPTAYKTTDPQRFWQSDPKIVPGTFGGSAITATHWPIYKGMKPIKWLLDPRLLDSQKQHPEYDVVGAMKRGVTNWNKVFGFEALAVEIAKPGDQFGDDDKNYVLWEDSVDGSAWGTERVNPNTGEMRNAAIFFSSTWLDYAIDEAKTINRADGLTVSRTVPLKHEKVPGLTWSKLSHKVLCVRHAGDFPSRALRRQLMAVANKGAAAATPTGLTEKEIVERIVTHVLLHEVGHTLGLRHNFKGSLAPVKSTSVMDYIFDDEAALGGLDFPSTYDTDAIKYLYHLSPNLPAQAFCTDEDTSLDPYCQAYDATTLDPLNDYWGSSLAAVSLLYTRGQLGTDQSSWTYYGGGLHNYLRADAAYVTATARAQAHGYAFSSIAAGAAGTGNPQRVNELVRLTLTQLFLAPDDGRVDALAPFDATVTPLQLGELTGNLANSDGLREYETRRLAVDVLKRMQSQGAYNALLAAQPALAAQLAAAAPGSDAYNDTKDLIARVNAAVSPYFL